MLIKFNKDIPQEQYYRVGVQENNLVDDLVFVIDREQGTIDLFEYTPKIKAKSAKGGYAELTDNLTVEHIEPQSGVDIVQITYFAPELMTAQKEIDMQVVFEKPILGAKPKRWQTSIFKVVFYVTINPSEEVMEAYPDIIHDLTEQTQYAVATAEQAESAVDSKVDKSEYTREVLLQKIQAATEEAAGYMTAQDKARLDTIYASFADDDGNNYVDTLKEILEVFSNYPEAQTIISALAEKVDKVEGKGLSTNDFTDSYKSEIDNLPNNYIAQEEGKGLSSNDFTSEEKTKLSNIADNAQVNVLEGVQDTTGNDLTITNKKVKLSKAAVGLPNVDNTADTDKPVSTLQGAAINAMGKYIDLSIDSDYKLTVTLKDANNNTLSSDMVDLPIESMIVNASYANGILTLTLQNGNVLNVDISAIISGLVPDSRTIAGIALSSDISAADLTNALVFANNTTDLDYVMADEQ